jgi:hypothetical protein
MMYVRVAGLTHAYIKISVSREITLCGLINTFRRNFGLHLHIKRVTGAEKWETYGEKGIMSDNR